MKISPCQAIGIRGTWKHPIVIMAGCAGGFESGLLLQILLTLHPPRNPPFGPVGHLVPAENNLNGAL